MCFSLGHYFFGGVTLEMCLAIWHEPALLMSVIP